MNKLSNLPPKGTSDWLPEEYAVRKYIFDTWRKVCTQFGYEEYLTPILESADIYRAKSGEDVGGKELMVMTDRAGRELAIRPEMTPSVTRMVSRIYNDTPKPLRLFSIANYFRNEKPQRGRNREFWQLNYDVFGSESINADVEVLVMAIEIMKAFGADRNMYKVKVNNRNVLSAIIKNYMQLPEDKIPEAVRIIDKYPKLPEDQIIVKLEELDAKANEWDTLIGMLKGQEGSINSMKAYIKDERGLVETENLVSEIKKLYNIDIEFSIGLARGFDYYDGMVFEVFDKNSENVRSLFGGGRYNGLAGLFGGSSFPAVGCAPGDETTKLFLEGWNLIPESVKKFGKNKMYFPILDESLKMDVLNLSSKMRNEGKNIETGLEVQKLGKALEYANKKALGDVIIFGTDEQSRGVYKIKNLESGEEVEKKVE